MQLWRREDTDTIGPSLVGLCSGADFHLEEEREHLNGLYREEEPKVDQVV